LANSRIVADKEGLRVGYPERGQDEAVSSQFGGPQI